MRHQNHESKLERRAFLQNALKGAALCVAGGFLTEMALSAGKDSYSLRPPGAEEEQRFFSLCVRCGLCVEACPYDTLKLSSLFDKAPLGTPFFEAREIPCYLCPDLPCVRECPTNALDSKHLEATRPIEELKMGIAVLDSAFCLAYWGIQCDACYRVCPLIDRALKIEQKRNEKTGKHALLLPVVDNEVCVGCGLCEHACITEKPSIRVLPREFVLGAVAEHYLKQERPVESAPGAPAPKPRNNAQGYLNEELL
ncbi:MAG: ferredoxin-type protein NapG [Helicobacter sp.]|nr:ferredoxin-type protein NapG [Helicobacter sp.]